jgi:hypothetical protein
LAALAAYRNHLCPLVQTPAQEEEGVAAETSKVDHLLKELQGIETDPD